MTDQNGFYGGKNAEGKAGGVEGPASPAYPGDEGYHCQSLQSRATSMNVNTEEYNKVQTTANTQEQEGQIRIH